MKQLETALVSAGLVAADETATFKAQKKARKAAALKRRNDLVRSLLPFGRLGAALEKARRGKRRVAGIRAEIATVRAELEAVNADLRGMI